MMKRIFLPAFLLILAFSLSSVALAQETKKEPQKEGEKGETETLKSVSCDPTCGFMVRSHDEKELTDIVMKHAKMGHQKDLTDADVKKMMKTKKASAMEKEMKKEVEKEVEKKY